MDGARPDSWLPAHRLIPRACSEASVNKQGLRVCGAGDSVGQAHGSLHSVILSSFLIGEGVTLCSGDLVGQAHD